jgi:hypothetical protein
VCIFHLSHTCYTHCPSHPPRFDHPNNIWWRIQIMKFLIMQPSPASLHFLSLTSECSNHTVPT